MVLWSIADALGPVFPSVLDGGSIAKAYKGRAMPAAAQNGDLVVDFVGD
mgnify:CR=1 FL=1|jgi:hypothetical protein